MRVRRQLGMTLIEVLIAVSLVSLLSVGMLFALRAGLTALDANQRRMAMNRRALSAQRILEQQVAGFLPAKARCGAIPEMNKIPGGGHPFFDGRAAVMHFATTFSLDGASRGMPKVVELFVGAGEMGRGVRLLVNEYPFNGPVGLGWHCQPPGPDPETGRSMLRFRQPEARPTTFVLADQLAFCRFLYLETSPDQRESRWVPYWLKLDQFPAAIRIEMAPLERDGSRIPPLTFTGSVRPNKPPAEQYAY